MKDMNRREFSKGFVAAASAAAIGRAWAQKHEPTGDAELDKKFIAGAKERGLINLKGHRNAGGMRASVYNAFPEEGVDALIAYMKEFEAENAK